MEVSQTCGLLTHPAVHVHVSVCPKASAFHIVLLHICIPVDLHMLLGARALSLPCSTYDPVCMPLEAPDLFCWARFDTMPPGTGQMAHAAERFQLLVPSAGSGPRYRTLFRAAFFVQSSCARK